MVRARRRSECRSVGLLLGLLAWLAAGCASAKEGNDDDDDTPTFDAPPGAIDAGDGPCGSCATNEKCCGGFCVDVLSNRNNCGDCNVVCDAMTGNGCSAGTCVCNFGPACSGGATCCATGCKNLTSDPQNCGTCARPCEPSEGCAAGMCVCATTGSECAGVEQCCPAGCVDTTTDEANCGDCGVLCDGGDVCTGGACNCSFTCPPALPIGSKVVCCADGCYDVCSDPGHCGGCDATTCSTCTLGGCDDGLPDLFNCFFPPI
jgi:hypothetical protein